MPYYCTVPRCTSMAGKAKNVSFHQFPRDEELAELWNRILKRGKPYTKYSKVCSLHFRPEDYTITSVGKNKGQWRTLRKDAIPSQNLPSESPVPYTRSSPGPWLPSQPTLTDPMVQQQMAQAIYMQTMLAMQAAGASEASGDQPTQMPESTDPSPSSSSLSEIELLLRRDELPKEVTYKCHECTKCFKDPDVFILHKRTHKNATQVEKENYTTNIQDREETLRANPILANLLKTSMRLEPESNMSNILTVENQIMAALASNMEAYIRTLSSMLSSQVKSENNDDEGGSDCGETGERDADADENDSVTSNKSVEETKDVNERFNVQVTACVSRIESPVHENQVLPNDANSVDNSMEGRIDAPQENTYTNEDQVLSNNINGSISIKGNGKVIDDFEHENQSLSDTKVHEDIHENEIEKIDQIETVKEKRLVEHNDDLMQNNDDERKIHNETSIGVNLLDEKSVENQIDDITRYGAFEGDEIGMCTNNAVSDANENQDLNAIDENGGKYQDNPECDNELNGIELET